MTTVDDYAPGSPEGIGTLARRFEAVHVTATDASHEARSTMSAAGAVGWQGEAQVRFEQRYAPLPGKVGYLGNAYAAAGRALTTYANELEQLRATASRYLTDLSNANQREAAATAAFNNARSRSSSAQRALRVLQAESVLEIADPNAYAQNQAQQQVQHRTIDAANLEAAQHDAERSRAHDDRDRATRALSGIRDAMTAATDNCVATLNNANIDGEASPHAPTSAGDWLQALEHLSPEELAQFLGEHGPGFVVDIFDHLTRAGVGAISTQMWANGFGFLRRDYGLHASFVHGLSHALIFAGGALDGFSGGMDEYVRDKGRSDLSGEDRNARIAGAAIARGGFSMATAYATTEAGAAIGTLLCPGLGTVAGGVIGAGVGVASDLIITHVVGNQWIENVGADIGQTTVHAFHGAGNAIGGAIWDGGHMAGHAVDKIGGALKGLF